MSFLTPSRPRRSCRGSAQRSDSIYLRLSWRVSWLSWQSLLIIPFPYRRMVPRSLPDWYRDLTADFLFIWPGKTYFLIINNCRTHMSRLSCPAWKQCMSGARPHHGQNPQACLLKLKDICFNSRPLRVRRQTMPELQQNSIRNSAESALLWQEEHPALRQRKEAEHLFHSFMITATDGAIKF